MYYIDKLLSFVGTRLHVCLHVGTHVDSCVWLNVYMYALCFMYVCVSVCGGSIEWISYQGSQVKYFGKRWYRWSLRLFWL